jgi:hypothetical protein
MADSVRQSRKSVRTLGAVAMGRQIFARCTFHRITFFLNGSEVRLEAKSFAEVFAATA